MKMKILYGSVGGIIGYTVGAGTGIVGGMFGATKGDVLFTIIGCFLGAAYLPLIGQFARKKIKTKNNE